MLKRISIIGLFAAWLCASGATLDMLQVFAWGRMFAGYARTMSIAAATEETMDSSKPCAICLAVRRARNAEQHQAPTLPQTAERLTLVLHETETVFVVAPRVVEWPRVENVSADSWRSEVPVPPPRAGALFLG